MHFTLREGIYDSKSTFLYGSKCIRWDILIIYNPFHVNYKRRVSTDATIITTQDQHFSDEYYKVIDVLNKSSRVKHDNLTTFT